MIYPMMQALQAFQVIFQAIPDPFRTFIVYSIISTVVLRLLLVVLNQ